MTYECKPCHISGPIKQRCPICSTPMIPRSAEAFVARDAGLEVPASTSGTPDRGNRHCVPAGPEPLRGDDGLNNRRPAPRGQA